MSRRGREGQRERMFQAHHALEGKLGRKVTQAELAQMVALNAPHEPPPAASVVARWLKGQSAPKTLALWQALAAALEVSPGWLAFGEGEGPGGPTSARPEPISVEDQRELDRLVPDPADPKGEAAEKDQGHASRRKRGA